MLLSLSCAEKKNWMRTISRFNRYRVQAEFRKLNLKAWRQEALGAELQNEFRDIYSLHTLLLWVTINAHLEALVPWTSSNMNRGNQGKQVQQHHVTLKALIIISENAAEDYEENFLIDSASLEKEKSLSQVVDDISDKTLTAGIEDVITDALTFESDYVSLKKSPAAFVNRLTKINIIKNLKVMISSTASRAQMMTQNYNNSKDEPTLFTFACPNARLGCDYIIHNKYYL